MPQVGKEQGCPIPPREGEAPSEPRPYEIAYVMGFDALLAREPSAEKLEALGASRESGIVSLPVLNRRLLVDPSNREVNVEGGGRARRSWALLVLHYLLAGDVSLDTREVSIGHFADCRGYLPVFGNRIIGRFLATVGSSRERFIELSERLGGTRLPGPGTAYRFDVLPRVPITMIRHEGDEELGPGANVVYRADMERLLPPEDRVVVAELLLDALSGKPIEEQAESQL